MAHFNLFLATLVLVTCLAHAVEFQVTNSVPTTPGGTRFTNEIGDDYSRQTLAAATDFIWQTFQQTNDADRKNVALVSLIIENMDGRDYPAYTSNNEIHVKADYIDKYSGDVKTEITGVLYHEMAHVWQWFADGVPGGLIEGIADFVRLKANLAPSHWRKAGQGSQWDAGYDVTALFLDYCDSLRNGFVAELNEKMRGGTYSADYFVELLGKTVDQLWSDYKAKYGNPPS